MSESVILKAILMELTENIKAVRQEELDALADKLMEAGRIFVAGAGRSGFAARACSNRLMHLGLSVSFVGEPTTPSIQKGDLLLLFTGSGETGSLKGAAHRAKDLGAHIAVVTIFPESSIGCLADTKVVIPGATPKGLQQCRAITIQPMGNAFEQMAWLVSDTVTMMLMERLHITEEEMLRLHANLE